MNPTDSPAPPEAQTPPLASVARPAAVAAGSPWRRRLKLAALWALGSCVGLSALLAAVVPLALPRVLAGPVSEALGRDASLERARFNPFTLRLSLGGLRVAGATPQAEPLFELEALVLDLSASSLWRLAPVVEEIRIEQPRLRVSRLGPGQYDIDDLITRFSQPKPEAPPADPNAPPPRFALHNLSLIGGELLFNDLPKARQHRLSGLKLGLPFVSNLDASDVASSVEPHLAFDFNGTPFAAEAESTPFAADRASRLRFKLGSLDLAAWQPYVPASVPLVLTHGSFNAELALRFAAPPQVPPEIAVSGELNLKALALADRQGSALASLGLLHIGLADVQPLRREVTLAAVRGQDVLLNARRAADGSLNWLKLMPAAPATAAAPATPGPAGTSAARSAGAASGASSQTGAARGAAQPAATAQAEAGGWALRLAQLDLEHVALAFQDESVRPGAALTLDLASLQGRQLRWPLEPQAPATTAQAVLRLLPGALADAPAVRATTEHQGELKLEASLAHAGGQVRALAEGWSAEPLAPYVAQWLVPRLKGRLGFEAQASWKGLPGAQPPQISLAGLRLEDVQLLDAQDRHAPALAGWRLFNATGVALDLPSRQITVQRVALDQPQLLAQRDAQGELNLTRWMRQPADAAAPSGPAAKGKTTPGRTAGGKAPASQAAAQSEAPWQIRLDELALDGARLRWRDEAAPGGPVALDVSPLSLKLDGLDWPARPGLPISTQGQLRLLKPGTELANAGQLNWQGKLGLAPLAWQGSTRLQRLPVHALAAYAGPLPVEILRAELGWQLNSRVRVASEGMNAQAEGDVRLTDLLVRTPATEQRNGEDLLSWQALALKGLRVALAPGQLPQVELAEGSLADFYARLLVTEQGHLNLNDLRPAAAASAPEVAASAAVTGAQSTSMASSSAQVQPLGPQTGGAAGQPQGGLPLRLEVGGLKLQNGRVDFTDRFIRPNYSAALSELNGSFGRFGTNVVEAAPLLLSGKMAGTGVLNIQGSVNPLARPLALDIQARTTDLELAPLTPYSAKYAGLPIERGKLSLDVRYRIAPDGTLAATNQLILNQLAFGEPVESPEATKLPVRLAVALLTDRHGVIDVNLPISGSVNDPQFNITQVVLKVIGNLIAKAVTAPFSMMMGSSGSDSLSSVRFEPGTARMVAGSDEALARIAQALTDRPALRMTVTGAADEQTEREAIRRVWLDGQLLAERRQELLRAGAPLDAPLPTALGPVDRLRLLKRLQSAQRSLAQRLSGPFNQQTPEQIEAELLASHEVNADVAQDLALKRGLAVRQALVDKGVASERLFLARPRLRLDASADNNDALADWLPSVKLTLGVK